MKITPEVRAFAIEQADKRCECSGKSCKHHLRGSRCKRGLRGDQWKVYWRREGGGVTRENIEAWCLECFDNNYSIPIETVALLALDIIGYRKLLVEDRWRAITLRSALRDAARRAAPEHDGGMVLNRAEDEILLEFPECLNAIDAARSLRPYFTDVVVRLNMEVPEICGAIHCGEITRWRNGLLVGDSVAIATRLRDRAGLGQLLLTGPAAESLSGRVALEQIVAEAQESAPEGTVWALNF